MVKVLEQATGGSVSRGLAAAVAVLLVVIHSACHDESSSGGGGPTFELGDPIQGLSAAESAAFERGRALFEKRFRPSEGLGPLYNATSCASCHSTPRTGGSSGLYRNFYIAHRQFAGIQSPLPDLIGPIVPAFGTPPHGSATFGLEGGRFVIPKNAFGQPVLVAQRNTVPIFGVGLFELVSNATIQSNADPEDADGDGISGRFNTDGGPIGRFGVKAQSNNIERFTRAPLQNQMGITSNAFLGAGGIVSASPRPQATGGDLPTSDADGVPDPEISTADLGDLIAFTRFLAPPRRKPFDDAARRGEELFGDLGCVKCHVPSLPSSRGPVDAYTDLLLHEMGPDLSDGIDFGLPQFAFSSAAGSRDEFRTQPLWGVSMHAPFLHDGRAETLSEAIELHGGEAETIRDDFLALTPAERADIIAFLEHL